MSVTANVDPGYIAQDTNEKQSTAVMADATQSSSSETAQPVAAKDTESIVSDQNVTTNEGKKSGVRRILGFGRKKDDADGKPKNISGLQLAEPQTKVISVSKTLVVKPLPAAPNHPYMARSPDRALHSPSPRAVSPAGSQIFERNVQDSMTLPPMPTSPVPGHLQVDDHIPSVLDASSEAITNTTLSPDTVEIVMHSSHQPAAVTVGGIGSVESMSSSMVDETTHTDSADGTSNYGTLDAADVRRLSFISFADVVQSEHAEHAGSRDLAHVAGLTSLSSSHRSPSPMRSPVSSQGFNTSPPTSNSASVKGLELSPSRGVKPVASPTLSTHTPASGTTGGELMIETMSQALRKTRSGDLSGARSPVSFDGQSERALR